MYTLQCAPAALLLGPGPSDAITVVNAPPAGRARPPMSMAAAAARLAAAAAAAWRLVMPPHRSRFVITNGCSAVASVSWQFANPIWTACCCPLVALVAPGWWVPPLPSATGDGAAAAAAACMLQQVGQRYRMGQARHQGLPAGTVIAMPLRALQQSRYRVAHERLDVCIGRSWAQHGICCGCNTDAVQAHLAKWAQVQKGGGSERGI